MKSLLFILMFCPSFFVELISKSDAEEILGQPVKLSSEKKELKDGMPRNSISYTGLTNDEKTNRSVNLYCIITNYTDVTLAKKAYAEIIKSNMSMPGQTPLQNIGNEAWYHTDNENFCYLLVRKNEHLLAIKVNKLTKKFSFPELKKVVEKIVLGL